VLSQGEAAETEAHENAGAVVLACSDLACNGRSTDAIHTQPAHRLHSVSQSLCSGAIWPSRVKDVPNVAQEASLLNACWWLGQCGSWCAHARIRSARRGLATLLAAGRRQSYKRLEWRFVPRDTSKMVHIDDVVQRRSARVSPRHTPAAVSDELHE
jgi:hypothetical protein